jgi:ATP-dependent protease Clp ATPase subunit
MISLLEGEPMSDAMKARCSFCSKSDNEAMIIVAGPKDAFICDECVFCMVEIIADGRDDWRKQLIEMLQGGRRTAKFKYPLD